jgi:integrase
VAVIVKRVAKKAGLATPQLSGHSLRAGFVTEAKKNGADDAAIMDQTGHKSLAMVHRYHRRPKKWEKPASAKQTWSPVGLKPSAHSRRTLPFRQR